MKKLFGATIVMLAVGCGGHSSQSEKHGEASQALGLYSLSFNVPQGFGPSHFALLASGSLKADSGTSIAEVDGTGAAMANTGTAATTVGGSATVGTIVSQAAVTLQAGSHVLG